MSDTQQIVGIAAIILFMGLVLYRIIKNKDMGFSLWLMCVCLVVGMVIF